MPKPAVPLQQGFVRDGVGDVPHAAFVGQSGQLPRTWCGPIEPEYQRPWPSLVFVAMPQRLRKTGVDANGSLGQMKVGSTVRASTALETGLVADVVVSPTFW